MEEPPAEESHLTEADFDSIVYDANAENKSSASWSFPDLPDVVALPEMEAIVSEVDSFADAEPTSEMASQLDVPPLGLEIPTMPEQPEPAPEEDDDDQEIEAMLASMMKPLTASAGG